VERHGVNDDEWIGASGIGGEKGMFCCITYLRVMFNLAKETRYAAHTPVVVSMLPVMLERGELVDLQITCLKLRVTGVRLGVRRHVLLMQRASATFLEYNPSPRYSFRRSWTRG
jgi:hypothetical protein